METYHLTKADTLEIASRPVGSYPVERKRESMDGTTSPEGWEYFRSIPRPDPKEGYRWQRKTDPKAKEHGWEAVEIEEDENLATEVTKYELFKRLTHLEKWPQFKRLLSLLPEEAQDAWNLTASIRSDDPLILKYGASIQIGLGLSDQDLKSLLS